MGRGRHKRHSWWRVLLCGMAYHWRRTRRRLRLIAAQAADSRARASAPGSSCSVAWSSRPDEVEPRSGRGSRALRSLDARSRA